MTKGVKWQNLCPLSELKDGESALLKTKINGAVKHLIAIRQGEAAYLYTNSCPHIGAPLDFKPGQFLNLEKTHILCSNHGAMFEITSGKCISGPCINKHLESIKSVIKEGIIPTA